MLKCQIIKIFFHIVFQCFYAFVSGSFLLLSCMCVLVCAIFRALIVLFLHPVCTFGLKRRLSQGRARLAQSGCPQTFVHKPPGLLEGKGSGSQEATCCSGKGWEPWMRKEVCTEPRLCTTPLPYQVCSSRQPGHPARWDSFTLPFCK